MINSSSCDLTILLVVVDGGDDFSCDNVSGDRDVGVGVYDDIA